MKRRIPFTQHSPQELHALLRQLGIKDVTRLEAADSGLRNTNYFVTTPGGELVLRTGDVASTHLAKEVAVLSRVELEPVPSPRVLAFLPKSDQHGPAYAMTRLPGVPMTEFVHKASDGQLKRLATSLGGIVATLYHIRFPHFGMLTSSDGRSLTIVPFDVQAFYKACLFHSPAGSRLGPMRDPLWALVQECPNVATPLHLVHSDMNPTNILVGRDGEVSGLIDWEFAHAGQVWTDLGNILRSRPEYTLTKAFRRQMGQSLVDHGVQLGESWEEEALLNDLASALDFLASPEELPERHARALDQVRTTLSVLGGEAKAQ